MNDYREISRRIGEETPQFSRGAKIMDRLAVRLRKRNLLPEALETTPVEQKPTSPPTMVEIAGFMRDERGKLQEPYNRFTEEAVNSMMSALAVSHELNHDYLGTQHILAGLAETEGSTAQEVLASFGIDNRMLIEDIEFITGKGDSSRSVDASPSPRVKKVVELAVDEAKRFKSRKIGTEHLLLGMIREGNGIALGIIENHGINVERIRAATVIAMANKPQ